MIYLSLKLFVRAKKRVKNCENKGINRIYNVNFKHNKHNNLFLKLE